MEKFQAFSSNDLRHKANGLSGPSYLLTRKPYAQVRATCALTVTRRRGRRGGRRRGRARQRRSVCIVASSGRHSSRKSRCEFGNCRGSWAPGLPTGQSIMGRSCRSPFTRAIHHVPAAAAPVLTAPFTHRFTLENLSGGPSVSPRQKSIFQRLQTVKDG
jgi:hypothetical protein